MAQPQPVASDEPVWVKDDDEDLEELVVNLVPDEALSTARQIDLQVAPGRRWEAPSKSDTAAAHWQVQLCMLVFCFLLALISLVALSWRKYGGIIGRSRNDPNWKVRELSPSMGPIIRGAKTAKKKD